MGISLCLPQEVLNAIAMAHKGDPDPALKCTTDVFERWRDQETSEYSWQYLAEVLSSKTVNKQVLVKEMHSRLCEIHHV